MIASDRITELVYEMRMMLKKNESWPDNVFTTIADRNNISGDDKRKLKKAWRESSWCREWIEAHPEEAKNLVW